MTSLSPKTLQKQALSRQKGADRNPAGEVLASSLAEGCPAHLNTRL